MKLQARHASLTVVIAHCVVPIHRRLDHARFQSMGSGVLIRVESNPFLLSAAHVLLDEALWLPGSPEFIELDAATRVFATALDLKTEEPRDLAYAHLSEFAVGMLVGQGFTFLDIADTVIGKNLAEPQRLTFSGYPATKSKTRVSMHQIENTRMDASGNAIPTADLSEFGCDPQFHVAMRFDRNIQFHDGSRITGPDPTGMSGGAVWHILPHHPPLLCAIATFHDPVRKILRGTHIARVIAPIARYLLSHMPPESPPAEGV